MASVLILELRLPAYAMTCRAASTIAAEWDKAQGYRVIVDGEPRPQRYPNAERTVRAAMRIARAMMRESGRM